MNKMNFLSYSLFDKIYRLIGRLSYPNPCPGCAVRLIPEEDGICLDCSAKMPRTLMESTRDNRIETILGWQQPLEAGMALFHLRESNTVQKLLYAMKYENRPDIGEALGRRIGRALVEQPDFAAVDTIIPLPLHSDKLFRRGYNQSTHIAMGIATVIGAQMVDTAMTRDRNTASQTKQKSRLDRHLNVDSAFRVTRPELLTEKKILLVDDVFTTGATAGACLRALAAVPETRLWFAAVAMPG